MIPALVLSLTSSFVIGALLVHLLWPGGGAWRWAVKVPLAAGVGVGATSVLFFLWRAFAGEPWPGVFVAEGLVIVMLAIGVFGRRAASAAAAEEPRARGPVVIFIAVFVVAAVVLGIGCAANPDGEWDAVAIWNLKARFLFGGGETWTDMFRGEMERSHRDYPLLLPGVLARAWTACGQDVLLVPMAVACTFGLAVVGLLFSALTLLHGSARGLLAALTLLATPMFPMVAVSQYADVPLGFFVLATVVSLVAYDREASRPAGLMALAGLACGLAAWTKNEGIVFFGVVAVCRCWSVLRSEGFVAWRREFGPFLAGAAPALAAFLLLKMHYAAANDIMGQDWTVGVHRALDASRYAYVLWAFVAFVLTMGAAFKTTLTPVGPAAVLLVALFLLGLRAQENDRRALTAAGCALGLTMVAYLAVYVITPNPISWQMETSLSRVLLHLWPSAIFLFFMAVRPPADETRP